MLQTEVSLSQLYEEDYVQWLENMASLLKDGQLSQLDQANLIEELEALGRSERHAVASLTIQILVHLLSYQYWETERERNSRHWQVEILTFRTQLNLKLTKNLRNHLEQNLETYYQKAYKITTLKTQMSLPKNNPFNLVKILDEDWLPEV